MKAPKMVLGWLGVVAGVLAWCLLVTNLSLWWENSRLATINEGETWTAFDIGLRVDRAWLVPSVTKSYSDETIQPAPGAVFLAVGINYVLTNDTGYSCTWELLGDDRSWGRTYRFMPWDIDPEFEYGCPSADPSPDSPEALETSGFIAVVFEVPQSALPEIEKLKVTVFDPRVEELDFVGAFDYPPKKTVMEFSLDE